jgi:hypothetical protein
MWHNHLLIDAWHLEHEEVQNTGEGQLLTLSAFADLRTHF